VQGASLLTLTFYSLEIVQTTFTGDFTLELPEAIEGHACSEGPGKKKIVWKGVGYEKKTHSYDSKISPVSCR